MAKRNSFETKSDYSGSFDPLIKGQEDFGNQTFDELIETPHKKSVKRGRPVEIQDKRFLATRPKKVSPALDNKLNNLKDYMIEFQTTKGRITFDKIVDTLAESYIKKNLGISKEELLRKQIDDDFDKIIK